VFFENKELLKTNKSEYLKKVREVSGSECEHEVDMLDFALCNEVVGMLYDTEDFYRKVGPKEISYRRIRRAVIYISDVLIERGLHIEVITENLMFNIFSIIGIDITMCVGNSPVSKIKSSGITYEIILSVNPSTDKTRITTKTEKQIYPEQKFFFFSFGAIMLFWSICAVVAIVAIGLQVFGGTTQNPKDQISLTYGGITYLFNGGIIALLFAGAKWILPLLKDSFDSSVKARNDLQTAKILLSIRDEKKENRN